MSPTADSPSAAVRRRFRRGLGLGFPILLGYVPVGVAFGIVARSVGFSTFQAAVCSATALAGAGQFIALSVLAGGAGLVTVIAATTVVNLRYVLFGATLSPYLARTPLLMQAPLGFTLTDETFAVNITDLREGLADDVSMAGVGAIAWTGWVAGTIAGAAGAGLIGDPSTWGVDFAMPAMFTALLVAQVEKGRHVWIALVAAVLAVALSMLLPGKWYIVAAATAAAALGAVTER